MPVMLIIHEKVEAESPQACAQAESPQACAQANPEPVAIQVSTRKRGRQTAPVDENLVCNDLECETLINDGDLLRCDSPGCYLVVSQLNFATHSRDLPAVIIQYHLTCRGLVEKPAGGWFCDDDCRRNAGFTVRKRRRRAD